jgi:predicted nucleic acid-binding Zn finger protein
MKYTNKIDSDPISYLSVGEPAPVYLREKISDYHLKRGEKALAIVDSLRVKRYRDFFVVAGNEGCYVTFDDFCTCNDFLHRGGRCGHILAMQIARITGEFKSYDLWFYETLIEGGL